VGKLIYSSIASLDGFVADAAGNFEWAAPDEEVHQFINDLERPIGTHLFGRRMYEVMRYWETVPDDDSESAIARDYSRIWKAAEKVVFSTTLTEATTAETRIERQFDPELVRQMKATSERDLAVGGPTLAAHAIRAGLVDEYQLFAVPAVVGDGTRSLPDDVRLEFELVDERRFGNGTVFLRYRPTS
jgi:dihydrofolate reductase